MDAIVLGAGVAGLTAAYHLKKKGFQVLLLEKSGRTGGCLQSVWEEGSLLEKGPNSFLGNQETIRQHLLLLGLQDQVVSAKSSAKKKFILSRGKLIPFPKKPFEFFKTPLLSPKGKCRFLLEPFISEDRPVEESIAQFVTRRLGKEAMQLVEPMVHGIYAGDCAHLSIDALAPQLIQWEKEYGSLFKAMKKKRTFSNPHTLHSFKNGMQTVTNALFESVRENSVLGCRITQITKREESWQVKWEQKGTIYEANSRYLISSLPAYEAATLLMPTDSSLAEGLKAIPYAPLIVSHLLIDRSRLTHPLEGFGFLAGAGEATSLLGSIWSSSLFENRCRDEHTALLTCFSGGFKNPSLLHESEDSLVSKVVQTLSPLLGGPLNIRKAWVTKHSRALPQYVLGHGKRVKEIQDRLTCWQGLHLVGNYLDGVSVNDTMRNALVEVERAILE